MRSRSRQKELTRQLREIAPSISRHDFLGILEIADAGHLRHLPPSIALWQAIISQARHEHTDYDQLMDDGYDQESARHFVLDDINSKLLEWGCSRRLDPDEN